MRTEATRSYSGSKGVTEWWKNYFDETYLLTDARTVLDSGRSRAEVRCALRHLKPPAGARILDLCGGQGRHAVEFFRRGFRRICVVDYSAYLVGRGKREAAEQGAEPAFLRADARRLPFGAAAFDYVLMLTNSFGYFLKDGENLRILREAARVLKPSGRLWLDWVPKPFLKKRGAPLSWHEATPDVVVCRQRRVARRHIEVRELALSKSRGLIREGRYCVRIYGAGELKRLVRTAGLRAVKVFKGFSEGFRGPDQGLLHGRWVLLASKNAKL